jgi:sporulation protein YlmC with PRC-barrel domain
MLRNASVIDGYAIAASDGQVGTVSDFLFDDASWLVRWLVVDTGNWLSGRKVLLPASVLDHLDQPERHFSVRLTMQQVKDSPDIYTDQPVSRQMETNIYDYYGWNPYWSTGYMGGAMAGPFYLEPIPRVLDVADTRGNKGDPHLRSIEAITGYHVHASDGEIGHVEDFLVQDEDWSIRHLVVATKNWWPGKKVLISRRSVREIDWSDKVVNLDIDRQRVQDSPEYEASDRG